MHLRRRPARDEGGAVAILVACSLVVLGMSCALAVDLGNVAQLHRHAEATVDDAAISGADLLEQGTDTLAQVVSATETYVDENWRNLPPSAWDTCPDIPTGFAAPSGSGEDCVTFSPGARVISVELPPQSVPFTVARLGGFTSGTVEASATAVITPGISPCALCVLSPSGTSLLDSGNGTFQVTDGPGSGNAGITVDSNTTTGNGALYDNGSGTIIAPEIGVVGSYSQKHAATVQPTPTTGVQPVPDPLGALPPPTPVTNNIPSASYSCNSNCGTLPSGTYGNVSLTGGATLDIPPGNYNNISVGGNALLTLETGTYFINGAFSVGGTGGASVQESAGVLLYFTCGTATQLSACASGGAAGGSLSLTGTGSMTLAPQTTGTYANLTVFYDRNNNAPMSLSGTPGMELSGTIYAKDAPLSLNGTGTTIESLIIVNTATINGNGTLGVNYTASQNVAPPGVPYLCSTTANNC